MKIVLFCHSLVSDWNHGNAHFLRGICSELMARRHEISVFEPVDGWSRTNLEAEHGLEPVAAFGRAYPGLRSTPYSLVGLNLDAALDGADVVLVHEWNDPLLVRRIGEHRRQGGSYRLLFHDTHHRSVSDECAMSHYELEDYDGVLAFGDVIRDIYERRGWGRRAWTWHEAADVRRFRPMDDETLKGDLIWIGNWGDDERAEELQEFLCEPVHTLRLKARVHGVRYPDAALRWLAWSNIEYAGWLPNYEVPRAFAQNRVTIHVPRRPYVQALPGVPTIRMFEALACGIPLISAPWNDVEGLFVSGEDYLVASDGTAMRKHLRAVLNDPALAEELTARALETVRSRHTCAHRVDELFDILASIDAVRVAA